jgi:hypothetical protein
MSIADAVDRFRQPEYTGANRCTPCTAVNLLIATGVAGVLTLLVPWVGVAVFVVFLSTIYLRGYLVPGTPALTKRYLPAHVLRLFGKQPIERSFEDRDAVDAATDTLGMTGVVKRIETDDIDLTPTFREAWRERMSAVRERTLGEEDVRELFDVETVSRVGDRSFVVDGNESVRWGSNAALVADVAAAKLLRERTDEWRTMNRDRQRSILRGLRLCLDRCPSCGGSLDATEERVDPCCQKPHLVAQSVCGDCGAALSDAAVVEGGSADSVRLRLIQS